MSLSQSQLRLISSIGIGVLVGTSMIVIIPEGMEAAMASVGSAHDHKIRSLARRNPWASDIRVSTRLDGALLSPEDTQGSVVRRKNEGIIVRRTQPDPRTPERAFWRSSVRHSERALTGDKENLQMTGGENEGDIGPGEQPNQKSEAAKHDSDHDDLEDGEEHRDDKEHVEIPTFEIGISLIMGFVLMFLIDRLPQHATETLHPAHATRQFSLDTLGGPSVEDAASVHEVEGFLGSMAPTPRLVRSLATTVGLVIHAAADGIAMGASSATSDMKLSFIIFVAIMIHKAPAAFGLTSVLLRQGLSKRAARGHLIVFSMAAPVGALSTYLLIRLLGGDGMDGEHGRWWTGMLLLFSGGTFL